MMKNIRCVAVLGQRNEAIDAVEEYCPYLGAALEKHAFSFEITRVEWATKGWRRALRELRQKVGNERNTWVLLQYTALAWSRRGFSLRVPGIIQFLKKNGARCAVVFHDVEGYYGNRLVDRIRRAAQLHSMGEAMRLADFSILTVQVTIHGLLPAEEVVQKLGASDVLLFTKGPISSRRGSAIAGIACGLPVIASEGWETGAPITEAGVVLIPETAKNEFGPALLRVLTDAAYRVKLSERSKRAQEVYFSWSAIAARYAKELRTRGAGR